MRKLLQKTNPRKTSGQDMIPVRLLKECVEELAPILAINFNKSLQTGTVPDDWKSANVYAVFKKGNRCDRADYCLVSLTCAGVRCWSTASNVLKHVYANKILTDCQHRFRVRRSCETHLVTLLHDLASALDKGTHMDLVVLHFSKSLDSFPQNLVDSSGNYITKAYKEQPIFGFQPSCTIENNEWMLRVIHQTAYRW